jgi:DnaJ-class molecular chaperone
MIYILGILKVSDQISIKNAYCKLVLKFHSDKNKYLNAKEVFNKISHAYITLCDN